MNIYLQLSRKDLVRLQFLLEGYERLSSITTIDSREAIVRIMIMPDFQDDFQIILSELKKSVDFRIIQS
ncbi:MAG: DUF4911 domain-containing protein [Syntrophales bacterium]|nr:DUF4911 domain-containing protein [Syntrophales bacterium]MCK9392234.1 DUF4911 domain-containing protein [Syntrophales bacterium]